MRQEKLFLKKTFHCTFFSSIRGNNHPPISLFFWMQVLEFYIFLMKAKSELCRFKRCTVTEQMFACAFRVPGTAVGPGGRDTLNQTDPDLVHRAIMFQWGRCSNQINTAALWGKIKGGHRSQREQKVCVRGGGVNIYYNQARGRPLTRWHLHTDLRESGSRPRRDRGTAVPREEASAKA